VSKLGAIETGRKDRIVGLYSQAHNLAIGGDYAQALELYDRIVTEVPELVSKTHRINYERALCLKAIGRIGEAEEAIRSCLDINPNDPEVLRFLREVQSDKQKGTETGVPGIVEKEQFNLRAMVIDLAMETVLESSLSGRFNALEVGCMFKSNEGLSTYRIADFISRCDGIKQFISIDYEPEHISACKHMLGDIDAGLLSEVQFVCGYSLVKLAPVLEKMEAVDFVVLDGGAEPGCCLGEFELAASRLSDNGLVVIDDVQDMKPTPAYSFPRPFGKATLILPCLFIAEYLRISNLRVHKHESDELASKDVGSEFVSHSSRCELLYSLGELRYTIVSEGNHKLLVVGRAGVLGAFHDRLAASPISSRVALIPYCTTRLSQDRRYL
jgi:predicted O-methyltransferase YrrM